MDRTPKQKMGKRQRRALDASARRTWPISPVTRSKASKKLYDRKKRRTDDETFTALFTSFQMRAAMV